MTPDQSEYERILNENSALQAKNEELESKI